MMTEEEKIEKNIFKSLDKELKILGIEDKCGIESYLISSGINRLIKEKFLAQRNISTKNINKNTLKFKNSV